ncbi:MAG: BON domain-containing protein [Proteobacteria bacterium]|jgi:osmotically-inducible protein OsmY|nr:BON domain-containing protein [Desulfocapsa sp.]MBU3943969.1 BON domain-containing protein [Pseudomonadota bacterium]MCG2744852.1 BON domain-containing protein [Desulfobacteraceae bacterium]MBU3983609.1 BON domain-containing protein [Pseudomonadota bacterium]MBU4028980.1 BON domain-containing protein [Pseudomonadota bacterium]
MKKTTFRLSLIVTVASLFLCNVSLFASETDDRIESSAQQSYVFRTYLKGDDIKVQSQDGVATLTGTVSGEAHKTLAQETVANLPGVTSVDNKLEEKGEAPAVFTDAWLVAKVKATFLFHRNLSATETEVVVDNGTVTLRGEATSMAQKDLATEYANDVEGVKVVKNEMTVAAAAGEPATKTVGQKIDTMGEAIDDASITALVKTTLLYHRSTSALNTTVKTKDGVVTLGGKAKNAAEKELATKLVSDVHGVKSVTNNMTIEEAKIKETKTPKKAAIEGC